MPKLNANTEKLLKDTFETYCQIGRRDRGDTGSGIDVGTWRNFGADCKIVEGKLTDRRLEELFLGQCGSE